MTRHLSSYGYRARLGLIVPPTNTVNESEWSRMMPEGVSFHTTRMRLHSDTTSPEGRAGLWDDLDGAIGLLTPARVDVVAYACTAGSIATPADSIPEQMTARSGVDCVTTAAAIVAALAALDVRRVAVATPYHQALNDHETAFLEAHGIAVTAIAGLGIGANGPQEFPRIAETPLERVREHAMAVLGGDEQALLITCTDFPSLPLIAALERETGLPAVTSNTATLWQALRRAGIGDAVPGGGRLFKANKAVTA
ncbi:MAG: maleate isomerase [Rhodobacteraceae bacterium HLUCCA12]|nr:MAG: maleate isomerase [Rhodobacteraceae bacterium HLUCCA12]